MHQTQPVTAECFLWCPGKRLAQNHINDLSRFSLSHTTRFVVAKEQSKKIMQLFYPQYRCFIMTNLPHCHLWSRVQLPVQHKFSLTSDCLVYSCNVHENSLLERKKFLAKLPNYECVSRKSFDSCCMSGILKRSFCQLLLVT